MRALRAPLLAACVAWIAAASTARAQAMSKQPDGLQGYDPLRVSMRVISFDPLVDEPIVRGTGHWRLDVESPLGCDYALMQLTTNLVPPDWHDQITAIGVSALAFLGPRSYIVRLPQGPEARSRLAAIPPSRWVGEYLPGYRVPPDVNDAVAYLEPGAPLKLWLLLFEGEEPEPVVSSLAALVPGIVIDRVDESGSRAMIGVDVPQEDLPDALERLAGIEAMSLVEIRPSW